MRFKILFVLVLFLALRLSVFRFYVCSIFLHAVQN